MKKIKSYILLFVVTFIATGIVSGATIFYFFGDKVSVYAPINNTPTKPVEKIEEQASGVPLFYGESVDMSQIIPGAENYILNKNKEDLLDIAHNLGVNMLRITNASDAFPRRNDGIYTRAEWNKVLSKLEAYDMKAIILIEAPNFDPKDYSQNYLDLVNSYVIKPGILDRPSVYAVDIRNEPVMNIGHNVDMMKEAARLIKEKYPEMKLTVGWWRDDTFKKDEKGEEIYKWDAYTSGRLLEDTVDFYSIHLYDLDKKVFGFYPDPYKFTLKFISNVSEGLQTKKPILIEEFGSGNGSHITDQGTLGDPEIQSKAYEGVYQAIIDNSQKYNILGSIAYTLYPKDVHTMGWNIVSEDGDYFYPAANILKKFSSQNAKN